jgi:hypothetical protein
MLYDYCTYGGYHVFFKRIGSIVYGRYRVFGNGTDSGWQATPFNVNSGNGLISGSGTTYGYYSVYGAPPFWGCLASVR